MENQLWTKVFHAVSGRNKNELKEIFSNCKVTDKMCTDVKSGDTAFHLICKLGDLEILRFLVEVCVDSLEDLEAMNFDRRTCLHEAVTACNVSVVKYLLEKGVTVDAVKRGEWTPLMLACANSGTSSCDIVSLLLRFGAKTKAQNKDGWTPVNLAVRLGDENKIKLLASVDIDALKIKTNNQRTILHTAALHGRASVLKFLLSSEYGCREMLSCTDMCGVSPFLDAAASGSLETVKVILSYYDALDDKDKKGLSALHHAARTGSVLVIEFLVKELGADVNSVSDIDRVTPLHVAAREKQSDVVHLLMKLGADTSLTDAHGRSVLDYSAAPVT
ncbi:ankyrin repeat domain-containing protein 16-like isoform X2 [Schistocerca cancellata]|nr:ankyrin repeat domain-containing protein 16-like isoform X2 [Schistocerca cancellata]XP_049783269.1 ankyrin repeat domain-containing protein 16-like isoform X2 [Schistocerca cancellata]